MALSPLKHDALGTTRHAAGDTAPLVERDTRTAHASVRWLARRLAAREAAILEVLHGVAHVPQLVEFTGDVVRRTYLEGVPLHAHPPVSHRYFRNALRVLRTLHRAGVAHNDLAKEANWIIGQNDTAAIIDFQIATHSRRRSAWFRCLAYEDLRHLLKHKRTYQPNALTARQRRVLAAPTCGARGWRTLWKPIYRRFTRGLLGWPERAGPSERQH